LIVYVARRVALAVLVVAGVIVLTFVIAHLVPGDPAATWAGPHASAAQIAAARRYLGLDRPAVVQLLSYVGGVLSGNWGVSIHTHRPVLSDLAVVAPASLELVTAAMIIALVVAVPLGLVSARWPGRASDHAIRAGSILGVSMPIFWFGIVLQIVFYRKLQLLPIGGRLGILDMEPPQVTGFYLIDTLLAGDLPTFGSALVHLILPASALAAGSIAVVTRMMRASVIEALDADHVRTARAKGLKGKIVLWRHVFRNALIPTTTVLGLQIGALLAGNVLAEVVFNWPGIGLYAVNAIRNLDYPSIMGVTLVISIIYVFVNLLVDMAYVVLDPRISYGGGRQRA